MSKVISLKPIWTPERSKSSNAQLSFASILLALFTIVQGLLLSNGINISGIDADALTSGSVIAFINLVQIITKNLSKFNSKTWKWGYLGSPNAVIQWLALLAAIAEIVGILPNNSAVLVAGSLQGYNFSKHIYEDDYKYAA